MDTPMNGRAKIELLKQTRPELAITVSHEIDPNAVYDGDVTDSIEFCVCYDWTVTATTIHKGELIEASAYLGGSWYLVDDRGESYQEVSGYLSQMIDEAIEELDKALKGLA